MIQKTETCWVWTGTRAKSGYGVLNINAKITLVHRLVWRLIRGPIPRRKDLLHTCDNPPCCNPDHLYVGTAKENSRDMVLRGRHCGNLTLDQVKEIREKRKNGGKLKALAKEYGCCFSNISMVCRKATFKSNLNLKRERQKENI